MEGMVWNISYARSIPLDIMSRSDHVLPFTRDEQWSSVGVFVDGCFPPTFYPSNMYLLAWKMIVNTRIGLKLIISTSVGDYTNTGK